MQSDASPQANTIDSHAIAQACARLEQGALVAFPTETVFGLGADAENPQAIARIYAAKGRPSNHPIIVHVAPEVDLNHWVKGGVPAIAQRLIAAFWPGPLTLILPRADHIPADVAGGQESIGVRSPSHPVALALLRQFKSGQGGIAAPSANQFGHVSPTTAQHVRDEFPQGYGGPDVMVLEGAASDVGIESTIVDVSRLVQGVAPRLLRPGKITAAQIEAVLGDLLLGPLQGVDAEAPRASGLLDAHYAPRNAVAQLSAAAMPAALAALLSRQPTARVVWLAYSPQGLALQNEAVQVSVLPNDATGYAQQLYAAMRTADATQPDWILIESPPEGDAWRGVQDRLTRACFATQAQL